MIARKDIARFIEQLFYDSTVQLPPIPDLQFRNRQIPGEKAAHHFGKVEMRHILDRIYEGPPQSDEECLHGYKSWEGRLRKP